MSKKKGRVVSMYQYFGKQRRVIHGHLSIQEISLLQSEGWKLEKRKPSRKPVIEYKRNGIPIARSVAR
ncbi:hypothetical protein QT711_03465 [Sporosarcina saromensis]|uniref:Uncharacterized protein n=1 Tax=Sporosarcina saromensis TaxID=359365 RepID=A0ABU4G5I6_9BACL|nr:hypothetical protein [Sporosarcina saromensis]MDW0112229.1 hypothetical protein [Sporosarcina saromensis]